METWDALCNLPHKTITYSEIAENIINSFPDHSKIECIKLMRRVTNCGLKEAKDTIDVIWTKRAIESVAKDIARLADLVRTTNNEKFGWDSMYRRNVVKAIGALNHALNDNPEPFLA